MKYYRLENPLLHCQTWFPDSVMPVLLQAAVRVREKNANKAEEILGQFADKFPFPDKSKVFLLARAQVSASAGHPQIAAESLLKIPDIQQKPATVASVVSLKESAGDIDVADAAIQCWSSAMTEDNKLDIIMEEAGCTTIRGAGEEPWKHRGFGWAYSDNRSYEH